VTKVLEDEELCILKPGEFNLDDFKSETAGIADVETLITALPHHRISDAKDFARLHPHDSYWSAELCFVNVPIKGMKRDVLHLIAEPMAVRYLGREMYQRFRLALASKPNDVFFLCYVPSQNLDNTWNSSNLLACEAAKVRWVRVVSGRLDNIDAYKTHYARNENAFPTPTWPRQSLNDLVGAAFDGRCITSGDHPALLRLVGDTLPLE
jgi:hypothetical protein